MNQKLSSMTKYLFDCDFFDAGFDAADTPHLDAALALQRKYPWQEIFSAWDAYLRESCLMPEAVINFVNLFFYYGGTDYCLQDPYDFIGYLYAQVDMKRYGAVAGELFQTVASSLLTNAGIINPLAASGVYYDPRQDPLVQEAAQKYQTTENA